MSIFPEKYIVTDITEIQDNKDFKEYAVNFETGSLLYDDRCKNIILTGKEALKVWSWKALQTVRNKYKIYSDNYGQDFESIIGKGYSKEFIEAELYRMINDCLLNNRHIKKIKSIDTDLDGSKLYINVQIQTEFGGVEVSV